MSDRAGKDGPAKPDQEFRRLGPLWQGVLVLGMAVALFLSAYQVFNLGRYTGYVPIENQYYYAVVAVLLPLAYIVFPVSGRPGWDRLAWYDVVLFLASFGVFAFLAFSADAIVDGGWEFSAPDIMQWTGLAACLLALEATRRAGGLVVTAIIAVFAIYPLFAGSLPGVLEGSSESLGDTAAFYALSTEALIGIPIRAFAGLVLGFLVFGVALQHTGAGTFFINLAFASLGHVRGGPAKVAIFASGLMGSLSGSVISNVITTGSVTIPAMKRNGFAPHVAGGVEACASTGGVLMPPIMGATAFIMATYLDVPYRDVMVAAVIPSLLYFFALFMQIDGYAARTDMQGMDRADLPSIRDTLKEGWHYVAVFVLLIYFLVVLQLESQAPFYATALLIGINQLHRRHRWNMQRFLAFLIGVAKLFAELAAILAGIGLIVGALAYSGKIGTLAYELLQLAGDSVLLLLLFGALSSFIMGIGVTVTVAYIILAVTLAPALGKSGLDPMGVHMFILYWGMLSYITPPVALGAFAAATLAGADKVRTGFEAMKLGTIIYFVPFFFVLDPGLIMQGPWPNILTVTANAVLGVIVLAMGLQGYLYGVGDLRRLGVLQWPLRALLVVGALAFAMPGNPVVGLGDSHLFAVGCVLTALAAGLGFVLRRVAVVPKA